MDMNTKKIWSNQIDNSFKGILNKETMKDANQFKSMFREEEKLIDKKTKKQRSKDMTYSDLKKTIHNQLNDGKVRDEESDYEKPKDESVIRGKFKEGNVKNSSKIKNLLKVKKVESKEATTSGSVGAISAPINFESQKMETKEATTGVGGYETTDFLAKSMKPNDWRGNKLLYPGGKRVSVKGKCKKFPYCNQGDIKALNFYEGVQYEQVIKNVSEKVGISEEIIRHILRITDSKV